jgi:hypothetical protein
VLGHLAKAGGAMTADEVERQVSRSCFKFAWKLWFHFVNVIF